MTIFKDRPARQVAVLLLIGSAVAIGGTALAALRRGEPVPSGPPATIVEGFFRALAAHDYDRALPYLSDHLLGQTIPLTLEVRVSDLERRTGSLRRVRGVPRWSAETRAYAVAEAESERAGRVTLGFGLARDEDDGAWRIDELYDLGWKPQGLW